MKAARRRETAKQLRRGGGLRGASSLRNHGWNPQLLMRSMSISHRRVAIESSKCAISSNSSGNILQYNANVMAALAQIMACNMAINKSSRRRRRKRRQWRRRKRNGLMKIMAKAIYCKRYENIMANNGNGWRNVVLISNNQWNNDNVAYVACGVMAAKRKYQPKYQWRQL